MEITAHPRIKEKLIFGRNPYTPAKRLWNPNLNCSLLIELLKACPDPDREIWAEKNWQNPQLFAEKIGTLAKKEKKKTL